MYAIYVVQVLFNIGTVTCPPNIAPTSTPAPSKPTQMEKLLSDPSVTNLSEVTDPVFGQSKTVETPPNHSSNSLSNIGQLVGIIVAVLVVAMIITLAVVLGFARCMKLHKNAVSMTTNEAYGTTFQDTTVCMEGDTYDYPSMEDQAIKSIDTKQNEAYATSAEAKPCVAYATNIITERNDAYGTRLQDMVLHREGDTYDYPNMDN